jgi:hypothetical protein
MRWRYPFTERLELSSHLWPRVTLNYERSPGPAEFGSSRFVVQEVDHCCSEILGIIRGYELFLVTQGQTFCAHCRRHDRFRHSKSFENLHARAAAGAQGDDVNRRLIEIRPHIVYSPRHDHAEPLRGIAQFLGGIPADDGE